MKIAVAGAGIAGLAAAAFLARDGHEVSVFDQFPEPRPVGSGMVVQPVGLAVLASLGRDAELRALASPISRIHGRNADGRVVLDLDYDALGDGSVGYAVQRRVLFGLLLDAATVAGARLRPGCHVSAVRDGPEGAALLLDRGETARFDLVLDCLGSGSPLCPEPARPLGYGALWTLLDWPEDGPFDLSWLAQRYRGASRMAGILPVGTDAPGAARRLTFFWSLRGDGHAAWRRAPLDAWKAEVSALWPETASVLGQITSHDDLTFARYAHRTLRRPARGRVAHLGDSYHATSPQLGQGANMALLDALAIAMAVRREGDPAAATARFARMRHGHVRLYQAASYLFTPVYQSDSRILPWLRDRLSAPLSRAGPMPRLLARLVAGEIGDPLGRIGADGP